jgi:hypothetical protein
VTIAQNVNSDVCLRLEEELNQRGLHLTATIDAVHVISVGVAGMATLASFALEP